MKISTVRAFLLSYPFAEPIVLSYFGGTRKIVKRDAMLIRVETASGVVGYAPGPGSEHALSLIENTIAPFLQGRILKDPDALRVQFGTSTGAGVELMKIYCCVEVALYDIAGKQQGVPVSELLGGRVRDRIALYGSAGMYMDPDGYAREAVQARDMGFGAYKMRPAAGPEGDIETVRRMRQAVGPDFGLMVDAHTWWRMGDRSYSPETVAKVAAELGKLDITWLEEPLPPADHEAYRDLRQTELVTVAGGEHEPDEAGFLSLIQNGCVDTVQMDVVCQGGFSMAQRIFSSIAREGMNFAFHCWGTDLEVAAAAQLGICWPESVVAWLEYPLYTKDGSKFMYEFPLAHEILAEPLAIERGDLIVSRNPGLGVQIDESVIEKYPWQPGPWSFFTLFSPPETFAVVSDHSVKWVL